MKLTVKLPRLASLVLLAAFVAASFEVGGANAQLERLVTSVAHNNLVDVIVAVGEVRKVNRFVTIRVDDVVRDTLITRELSKLLEWLGELPGKPILAELSPGSEEQIVILEYSLISKYSPHFKVHDELVIGYKPIEGGRFLFERASIVNRHTY